MCILRVSLSLPCLTNPRMHLFKKEQTTELVFGQAPADLPKWGYKPQENQGINECKHACSFH